MSPKPVAPQPQICVPGSPETPPPDSNVSGGARIGLPRFRMFGWSVIRPYLSPIGIGVALAVVAVGTARWPSPPPNTEFRLMGELGREVLADIWVPAIRQACTQPVSGPILVRIRSGGGDPGEGARIAAALEECRRPVLTLIEGIGASAAMLPATAGAEVAADPYALAGGLGIVQPMTSWAVAADRFGIADQSIASGPLKLAGSPLTILTSEARASRQATVDQAADTFFADIHARRPTFHPDEAVRNGALVTAARAKDLGLIDTLRTVDAIKQAHPGDWFDATPRRPRNPKDTLADVSQAVVRGIRAELSESTIR